jgi:hypothetical protein
MQDRSDFPEEIFGFHAQQVIEKSLKAWLTALHLVYPKSHDVNTAMRLTMPPTKGWTEEPLWVSRTISWGMCVKS